MFEATIPLLFVGLHAVAYSGIGAWIFLDPYFYLGLEQLPTGRRCVVGMV